MKPPSTEAALRLGSAALGMLVGLLLGFLAAIANLVMFHANPSFPALVFGFGAIGALIGLVYPGAAWNLVEGTIHFLFGMLGVATEEGLAPNHDAPLWLKVLLWLGVATGLFLALVL